MFRKLFGLRDAVAGESWIGCDARGRRNVGVVGSCVCIDDPVGAELYIFSSVQFVPVSVPFTAVTKTKRCVRRGRQNTDAVAGDVDSLQAHNVGYLLSAKLSSVNE